MESIYKQMNKIDDKESLNERYNVRTLKDVKKLHEAEAPEADHSSITISNVRQLLHKLKEELPYGFLTVTSDAVRYFTEEMDGVHYSKITELLTELQNDPAAVEEAIEDPMCLIDYFTESHFVSQADEVEFFAEKVRELNLEYFGTEKVDEIDDEFDAACASTMELFDENYNVRTPEQSQANVENSTELHTVSKKKKLSKNDIIYRYNFGLPMSEEDVRKIGTVEQHEENAKRTHAAVLAIKKWDPSISVSRKKDWTSMTLFLRRGSKGELTDEEKEELTTVISNVSGFKDVRVYGGNVYLRCHGFVSIGPDVREFINQ